MTGSDVFQNLTARQRAAVEALAHGASVTDAATAGGCSPRTLQRWRTTPEVQAALRELGRDAARESVSLLLAAQQDAVSALRKSLTSRSDATRVRAARALLEVGQRVANVDLEQRVTDLEGRADEEWHDGPTLRSV